MKDFHTHNNIGKAKYVVSFHDGVQKHKDGSKFYGIATFSNKVKFNKFVKSLLKDGYVERNFAWPND